MPNTSADPWNIGDPTLKNFALGFYVIINYLGVIINTILIWSIARARDKSSRDIFIISLSSGCLMMSLPCATQCLFNWISTGQHYQYGSFACYMEAFFHVSAIMVQFLSIMMIAWNNYKLAVKNEIVPTHYAIAIMFVIWMTESLGTVITGTFSEAILMPAGAYCFFDFTSVIIVYWFCPTMLITLFLAAYYYICIFRLAKSSIQLKINSRTINPNIVTRQVALRSSIFIVTYFIGWFPAVIACIYALIHGNVTLFLDTFLAISGSLNSIWQPIAYGIYNRNLHKFIGLCVPACRENLGLEIVQLRGRETIVTAESPAAVRRTSKENQPKRGSPRNSKSGPDSPGRIPLPGQVIRDPCDAVFEKFGEVSYLDISSPTKTGELLSPPTSPEKKSPDSYRKHWKTISKNKNGG